MPHPAPASLRPPAPPTTSTPTQDQPVPFSGHYAAASVSVEVDHVHPVQNGQWRRATPVLGLDDDVFRDPHTDTGANVDEDREGQREDGRGRDDPQTATVTLSSVLDNMIVLEELIKELVAVIVARRALGIDQVGFVARRGQGAGVL